MSSERPISPDAAAVIADIDRIAELSGVSVHAACLRAGIKPGTVSRWRSGEHEPSLRAYRILREAFAAIARERRLRGSGQ